MSTARDWLQLNERIGACARCPRLREYGDRIAVEKRAAYRDETYWGRPIPNLGDPEARLLLVGLAPGAHGAHRTGRMFTGDGAGDFLFDGLRAAGLAAGPAGEESLLGAAITGVIHCAPPGNRPLAAEIAACAEHLDGTVDRLPRLAGIVALGGVAFDATVRLLRRRGVPLGPTRPRFGHGVRVLPAGGPFLLASYHTSRLNTSTKRLTRPMLLAVLREAARRAGLAAG
ncbi:MAG: uracil-DNA glycosylase [Candidatus Eisenbacteria bacterium]|nr:uracil-DNA glycosylase [Candidatus Eisenbacteria bacterium]